MKKTVITIMASLFAITSQAQVLNESFESWPAQGWSSNPSEGEKVWTQSPENCSGYFRGPGKAYDGTHAALLNVAMIPLNTPVDLVSPNFDISDMHTPELRFAYAYYRTAADPFRIEVFAGSEKTGAMEYEKIADIVPPLENKGWNEFSRVLPRDTKKVMFRAIKNVGASFATLYVDAVSLSNGPDVAPPTDLEASPVVGHDGEINISWRVPNEEDSWIVKLSKNELDPSSDRAEIEKIVQGKPEVTVEGLDPGIEYHLYVQTVDGEKRSSWSHRRIMVNYAPVTLPAAFDFDNDSNGFLFIQDNQRNGWSQGSAATDGKGGALYISGDNGETYGYDCVTSYSYAYRDFAMPDEMENGATLTFDFRGMGSNPNHAMKVFLTDDLSIYPEAGKFFRNGKQIGETYCGKEDWTKCKIEIPSSYAGKHVRLILFWYNNNSSAQYATPPAAVDNLKFEKSLVMTPNELILSDPTTSTVDIEWNEQGNADNWRLQYKPYNASDDVITTVEVSQTPQYTAGGLDDCTQYSFRVCAVKGDNMSDFTDWMTIATKSLDKTAPYYSGFDDIEGSMFPAGWSYSTNFTGGDVSIGINDAVYHSAPNSVMLYARTDRDEQTLITPPFADLSDHDKRITFYARIDPLQTLTVGVMSDPDDPSTFKPVKKYYGTDYVTFNGIVNVAENHRHILNLDSNDITPEHKYIAFRAGTGFQCSVTIDDFVYEYIPVIKEPVDIRLLDATDESARIHWNAGSEEKKWEIAYGENDFDVSVDTPDGILITDFAGVELTDLEGECYYTVFVRPVMSDGTKGGWSESYFFRTYNLSTELPYMENFDGSRLYGIAPFGWQVKDFGSNWMLVGSDNASSGRNCVVRPAGEEDADDWIFLPRFELEKYHNLFVSMRMCNTGIEGSSIEISAGDAATPEAMTTTVVERQQLTSDYRVIKNTIVTRDAGYEYIGLHFIGKKGATLWLDDVLVEDRGAVSSVEALENITEFSVTVNEGTIRACFGEGSMGCLTICDLTGAIEIVRNNYLSGSDIHARLNPGCHIVRIETEHCVRTVRLMVR